MGLLIGWTLAWTPVAAGEDSAADDEDATVVFRRVDYEDSQPALPDSQSAPSPRRGEVAQPPPTQTALSRLAPTFTPRRERWANTPSGRRIGNFELSSLLADAPAMLSHFYYSGGVYLMSSFYSGDVPLAGGCGRFSVADNNRALTQDRVYVSYNHFHNAVQRSTVSYAGWCEPR